MRFSKIEHMLEIDKCKSISKAASNLYMSQPSLTKELNSVEEELGFQLFIRSNKGIERAPMSEEFFVEAPIVLNYYNSWKNIPLKSKISGKVKIAVFESLSQNVFSDVVLELLTEFPDLQIDFNEMNLTETTKLNQQDFDIAIVCLPPSLEEMFAEQCAQKNLIVEKIYSDKLKVFMNKKSKFATADYLEISNFKELTIAMHEKKHDFLYQNFLDSILCKSTVYLPSSDTATLLIDKNPEIVSFWPAIIENDAVRIKLNQWCAKEIHDFPMPCNHYLLQMQPKFTTLATIRVVEKIKAWYEVR